MANPILRAEKMKGGVAVQCRGDIVELTHMYGEITAAMFACFIDDAKGDTKEKIVEYGINAMVHTLLCGIGISFERGYKIDAELKPVLKQVLKKQFPDFDFDIDVYFMDEDDNETMKKAAHEMLDDLQDRANKAAKRGDIRAMLEVLERLADMAETIKDDKEQSK